MKKEDAVERLDQTGRRIHELHASAWNTALHPTRHGWGSSIVGLASIPVLSFASIGHMVGSAVVNQIGAETFERLTDLPGGDSGEKK